MNDATGSQNLVFIFKCDPTRMHKLKHMPLCIQLVLNKSCPIKNTLKENSNWHSELPTSQILIFCLALPGGSGCDYLHKITDSFSAMLSSPRYA